ncbi:MAG: RNA polymerase sigma factor [Candidatus Hydrogenedentes bacterium]|jgi:RNA polymerase sigma-70 factor (ECF subfamily)|nr:RNA polymerase sigma factor [Candidatus Hydrogenedentota bacterium]
MTTVDAALLNRYQRDRDAQAFAELVARRSRMVYGACRRITLDEARAEVLAQDCFMKLADSRPKIGYYLGPWLHRVATNVAISEVRSHSRRVKREKKYSSKATELAEPSWDDIQDHVDEAVNHLSETHRTVIVLHFFEGTHIGRISKP